MSTAVKLSNSLIMINIQRILGIKNKDFHFYSVIPSPSPHNLRPTTAATTTVSSTFPRTAPSRGPPPSCACCTRGPTNQPALPHQPNRPLQSNARSKSDDEIIVCPPTFPAPVPDPDYKTCYDGDIRTHLTGEKPELPLCLQNIILQHVQNAQTSHDKYKEMRKSPKYFVVPEDSTNPVAFTETFPQQKKARARPCRGKKPVHTVVGIFTFIMSMAILIIIVCVYCKSFVLMFTWLFESLAVLIILIHEFV